MSADFVAEAERRMVTRLAEIDAARAEAVRVEHLRDAAPLLLAELERCRSLLAIAEGQFPPEFNQRVRDAVTSARDAIGLATRSTS